MMRISSPLMVVAVMLTLTILIAAPNLAEAQGHFRCGTKLVRVGNTKSQILSWCGPPDVENPGRDEGGATWIYTRGSARFSVILRFVGPKLSIIENESQR